MRCKAGHYCTRGATEAVPCVSGTYLDDVGGVDENSCKSCPEGYYCPDSAQTDGEKYPCPEGHFCPAGQSEGSLFPCEPGYKCVGGKGDPERCEAGTYQLEAGQTSCVECPSGSYCDSMDTGDQVKECPLGSFCPKGTAAGEEHLCPSGKYGATTGLHSEDDCGPCPAGKFCPNAGTTEETLKECTAGFVCQGGCSKGEPGVGDACGGPCPVGRYCPSGSSVGDKCAQGTYNSLTGKSLSSHCVKCSVGFLCNEAGLETPVVKCPAGYMCTAGVSEVSDSMKCRAGHFCQLGTTIEEPCPAGKFSNKRGLTAADECDPCTAGFYCSGGETKETGNCKDGYYCPAGSSSNTQNSCPAGSYCPGESPNHVPCPDGKYMGEKEASICLECPQTKMCSGTGTVTPDPCPKGQYCTKGIGSAGGVRCPTGTYNPELGAGTKDKCLPCTSGHYCESTGLPAPTDVCEDGFYCESGVDTPRPDGKNNKGEGRECDAGFYCKKGVGERCEPGFYSQTKGLSECKECEAGYLCLGGEESGVKSECTPGGYCTGGNSEPELCPIGTYSAQTRAVNSSVCQSCPPGQYCREQGTTSPQDCDPGYYCTLGATSKAPTPDSETGGECPAGSFCNSGSSAPAPCSPGWACTSVGLENPDQQCAAGYYCTSGASVINPDNMKCPKGKYCGEGTTEPAVCPEGTYRNTEGAETVDDCEPCPAGSYCQDTTQITGDCMAGFYCPEKQTSGSPYQYECKPGHFCEPGSTNMTSCPPGHFQQDYSKEECLPCDATNYCPGRGTSTYTICPEGYYCPEQTGPYQEYPCPAGTYSNTRGLQNEDECLSCPEGFYCEEGTSEPTMKCSAGYYCDGGATNATHKSCPVGRYCPEQSGTPKLCPAGTFRTDELGHELDDCTPCTAGHYCVKPGLDKVSGQCAPQYYCTSGAEFSQPDDGNTGNICPVGKYCTQGTSTPYNCPAGSYMDQEGNSDTDCFPCPGGKYCGVGDETGGEDCDAGYYCNTKNTGPNPGSDTAADIGGPCPEGTYCPAGSTRPLDCSDGTYNNATKAESCIDCPAGFYCDEKINFHKASFTYTTGIEPKECPQGYFCPEETGIDWVPCERGTFGAKPGLIDQDGCTDCTAGHYCDTSGLLAPAGECQAGYYCTSKATQKNPTDGNTGNSCGLGTYCPTGSEKSTECEAGTYNNKQAQASCQQCHAGYTCEVGATDYQNSECKLGHWCAEGSSQATATKCDQGTFNPDPKGATADACKPCTAGYFCATTGLDGPTEECEAGYYCTGGAMSGTPPTGDTGGQCTPGHICPRGSETQQPCPARYFCQTAGMSKVTDDDICPAKYYCPAGTDEPDSNECTAGNYCPEGTGATPAPCPAGKFSSDKGLSAETQCTPCQAGFYCPLPGQTQVDEDNHVCPEGYYCPAGTDQQNSFPCEPGSKCPQGQDKPVPCEGGTFQEQTGQTECVECPAGKYCEPGVLIPADCPAGHYCGGGNTLSQKCPAGTKSLATQLTAAEDCTLCPAGKYCDTPGKTTDSGNCLAGSYCKQGAKQADPPADALGNKPCPPGSYCLAGTTIPTSCPLGTYLGTEGGESVDDCVDCDVGKFCNALGLTQPAGDCSAGYYCVSKNTVPTPNEDVVGRPCDAGHYCEAGKDQQECPPGTFSAKRGLKSSSECDPCPAGKYCEGGKSSTSGDCEPGCYCPAESSVQCQEECTAGNYCEGTSPQQVPCPDGSYQDQPREADCAECGAGRLCPTGSEEQLPCKTGHFCPGGTGENTNLMQCPAGTYSNKTDLAGEEDCTPCDGGWFCDEPGLTAPVGQCEPGYYCTSGVNSATPSFSSSGTGGQCQAGYKCGKGSVNQVPCDAGTYSDTPGSTECKECVEGYVCKTQAATYDENPCEAGNYCPEGSSEQTPCTHGTYNPDQGSTSVSSCKPCEPGQWCSERQSSPNGPCKEGWFCTGGSSSSTPLKGDTGGPCTEGSYCPEGSPEAIPCERGYYCPDTQQAEYNRDHDCEAGYYCDGGASTPTQHECPAGSFCETGSSVPEDCPTGTFSSTTKLTRTEDCTPCTEGKYCSSTGLTEPTDQCKEGYFCVTGSIQEDPELCPLGHYCPTGSSAGVLCKDGTWASAKGKVECDECEAGQYCTQNNLDTLSIATDCPVGYWCPAGTSNPNEHACPAGTYGTSSGLSQSNQCTDCIAGFYCDQSDPTKLTGKCAAGHYCTGGATTASPGKTATQDGNGKYTGNRKCPIGHYCPVGSVQPEQCPKGTYSTEEELTAATGETGCTPCGPGKYCDQLGATSADVESDCERGYICVSGSDIPNPTDTVRGYICPAGSYCLAGSTTPTPCAVNSYQPAQGKWDCFPCEEGRQCDKPGMSEAKECPPGYYCLSGQTKTPCPVGTYSDVINLATDDSCLPCKQGYYCDEPGQQESVKTCKDGHYCGGGAKVADPLYDCKITNSSCNGKCPPGHYCEDGIKNPCPAGTYYDKTGAAAAEDCLDCTAGYYCNSGTVTPSLECTRGFYCPGGSSSPEHLKCPKGHSCGPKTGTPEPCPASMYQPQEGQAQCNYCTESHYCPRGAVDMLECLPHSYCPHETGDPPPLCERGTYTEDDVRGLRKPSDCQVCPISKYCTNGQITGECGAGYLCVTGSYESYSTITYNTTNHLAYPCPPGHYCLAGSEAAVPCPVDTYRNISGGAAPTDCVACPRGWQCPEGSITGIPCEAGSYCPSDSDTTPCPVGYYNDKKGQTNMQDACVPCPPGYYCNELALPTKDGHECPVGHFCPGMNQIVRCPVGFMRDLVGGKDTDSCAACSRGRFCDGESDSGHISGQWCPAGYYCHYNESSGTPAPKACPSGYFCPNGTNTPEACPAGYSCPAECTIPEQCEYPYYCPEGSVNRLTCPLGWKAASDSGALRTDLKTFCTPCNAGLYGNLDGTLCLSCPEGHYCVEGTNGPDVWNGTYTCPEGSKCPVPCPQGTFCQLESPWPTPCPAGTYNDMDMGVGADVCKSCSPNTYNFFDGQAKCKPCGSSAESEEGAKVCTCVGANRYFLMSDGSCRCKSGFVFYDETDRMESDGNSIFDCQRAVDERLDSLYSDYNFIMSETSNFLHNILGDTHQGRLVDKLGNFATENYGEKGLQFFNTLTVAQVLYQLYEAREEKRDGARKVLGKITTDKINDYCKNEKDADKQKAFAAKELAIYERAINSM
ncbi:zonadhesin-like [Bolinopsis microptera]|uniref:zonadhesin-like n=1 Tax=Bolinopsis microptera TaxID=2820187 RepID=UPI00307A2414